VSVYRDTSALTCRKCGSDLAGRMTSSSERERGGRKVEVQTWRCRCGGGRYVTREIGSRDVSERAAVNTAEARGAGIARARPLADLELGRVAAT
jgi:hypothetical protein